MHGGAGGGVGGPLKGGPTDPWEVLYRQNVRFTLNLCFSFQVCVQNSVKNKDKPKFKN